mgnify:CR=1 FL=1
MRALRGMIVVPAETPELIAARVVVEVRDVSFADAPSTLVAATELRAVPIRSGTRVLFDADVPEIAPTHSLSVSCHVDIDGDGVRSPGDFLSTQSLPVPVTGALPAVVVPVRRIGA